MVRKNRKRSLCPGERLEPRRLLAALPIISEFQADNKTTLLDGDGIATDWIELYNPSDESINLQGWHLTDDAGDLNKWVFPEVELPAEQFLVVFASGQGDPTYVDTGGFLHTDFRLDRNGEYLALVEPDGEAVASEFAPAYPPQSPDVSYGRDNGCETHVVIGDGALMTAFVPPDGTLSAGWTSVDFDDTDWIRGTTGVGFEQLTAGTSQRDEFDTSLDPEWTLDIPAESSSTAAINNGRLRTTVSAAEDIVADRGLAPLILRELPPPNADYEFVTRVSRVSGNGSTGIVLFDALSEQKVLSLEFNHTSRFLTRMDVLAGTNLIGTKFEFNQSEVSLRIVRDQAADSWQASYRLDDADDWSTMITVDEGGDDLGQIQPTHIGLVSRAPDVNFVSDFHYTELNTGDEQPFYQPFIGTAAGDEMSSVNASIYTRIPFTIDGDATLLSELDLAVDYDDGFVAYLNGTEIARRNAPPNVTWNSHATDTHMASVGKTPLEVINVDAFANQLQTGGNLLAIHGLNVAADDRDFFLSATLTAINPSGESKHGYFVEPTPGDVNTDEVSAIEIVHETVQFSQGSKTFVEPFMLTLFAANGDVFYTTDGTVPNDTSRRYSQPIPIDGSTRIRARVIEPGKIPGPTASSSFVRLASDVAGFASDLPVLLIDNFGQGRIPNTGWNQTNAGIHQLPRQSATLMLLEPTDGDAQLTQRVGVESRIGIRVRGAFSSSFPQPGYSVETWDDALDVDQDIEPLGMTPESDWVLYAPNPSYDQTLIDNTFLFRLSNEMGHWAPDFRYVEAFVNTDGDVVSEDDHVGLYVIVEKVKRDAGRLDFEEFAPDGQRGGWLLEINRMDSISVDGVLPRNFHTAGPNGVLQTPRDLHDSSSSGDDIPRQYNAYINYDEPNGFAIFDGQRTAISSWVQGMEDVLYGRTEVAWNDPDEGYAKYMDVDSFVDYFILNNISKNGDAMLLSLWIYNPDPANGGKLTLGPIWDADLGSFEGSATSELFRRADRLWYQRLFQDPDFMQHYVDRWQELRRGVLSDTHVGQLIEGFQAEIGNTAAVRDGVSNWPSRLNAMEQWIIRRANAIDATFVDPPQISPIGGTVVAGTLVNIQTDAAAVWYTTDGTDPRLPDGAVSPTAISVEPDTNIMVSQTVEIVARALEGSKWSGPASAVFVVDDVPATSDNLTITEINYHPTDPVALELQADETLVADDFEFVELANVAGFPVLLQDVAFVEGISFAFPLVELSVGQRIVVVRNEAAFRLRYGDEAMVLGQYDGRLSNGGERLSLVGAGSLIASFAYDDSDLWPATADGVGATLELRDPGSNSNQDPEKYYRWRGSSDFGGSPGEIGADPIGVVINEVLAHSESPSLDAIELFNPTDSAIDISGWLLSDAAGDLRKYEFPAGTTIAPGAYLVIDERYFNPTPNNPAENDFALSSSRGDDVYLVISDGNGGITSFVDDVHFRATPVGETIGRIPNGSGRLAPQGRSTLGCDNSHARVGPLVISELSYNPGEPSTAAQLIDPNLVEDDLEFVEIYNPTTQAVSLANWRLRGGVDFDFDATKLVAGGTLVIISFDPSHAENSARLAAFRAQYGIDSAVPIVGGWSGQLSDSGEEVRLERPDTPPPENLAFTPRVTEDFVLYDDSPPWPVDADGRRSSLVRLSPTAFGGDVASWFAGAATPGSVDFSNNVAGDFTGDGIVSANDIDLLLDSIRSGRNVSTFDLDGNRVVDQADVSHLVEMILATHLGDTNLDGIVDATDLNQVGIHWQEQACHGWAHGDFTGDGAVTALDLNVIGSHWQRGATPAGTVRVPRAALAEKFPSHVITSPNLIRVMAQTSVADDALNDPRWRRRVKTEHSVRRRIANPDATDDVFASLGTLKVSSGLRFVTL